MGLIFAEFVISLKSPKIDTAKNKPYYTSSLSVFEIAKIGLSENLTRLPSVIFAKISRREKLPIYGIQTHRPMAAGQSHLLWCHSKEILTMVNVAFYRLPVLPPCQSNRHKRFPTRPHETPPNAPPWCWSLPPIELSHCLDWQLSTNKVRQH